VDLSAGKAWRYRYGRQLYDGIPDALTSIENAMGSDLQDMLVGDAQANRLEGLAGADQLDGGAGADTLAGGAGDDTYVVDNAADVVTENANEGIDTVRSSLSWTLGGNLENLTLLGAAAINGTGNVLNNLLLGNAANNVLNGGLGSDTLTGGAGSDRFVFAEALTAGNADTITDFKVSEGDTLALDDAVFTLLAGKTSLTNHFRLSTQAAVGGDDYLVYNPGTGALSYDASGKGTGTAQVFATLANKPQDLTAAQFAVI
jgi:Ca2+-binding RTX toxin-like protein